MDRAKRQLFDIVEFAGRSVPLGLVQLLKILSSDKYGPKSKKCFKRLLKYFTFECSVEQIITFRFAINFNAFTMKHLFPFSLIFVLLIYGCGPQGALYEYQGTNINFGSGGGYSGQVSTYTLSTTGKLEITESLTGKTALLPNMKKSKVKKVYSTLAEMDFEKIQFNHPGNMYYFIEQAKGDTTHKVVWGDGGEAVPAEVQSFYDLLISSMN